MRKLFLIGMVALLAATMPAFAQSGLTRILGEKYVTVAASQTAASMGTGATGDKLSRLIIVPATLSPGVVQIKDGSGTAITVFTGGAASVADLKPIYIEIGAISVTGKWQVTTGANVSVVAVGNFTP